MSGGPVTTRDPRHAGSPKNEFLLNPVDATKPEGRTKPEMAAQPHGVIMIPVAAQLCICASPRAVPEGRRACRNADTREPARLQIPLHALHDPRLRDRPLGVRVRRSLAPRAQSHSEAIYGLILKDSCMLRRIKKAAVIGAGTMGSGIASHLANAGVPVVMLDIVPEGAENRNSITENALQRLRDSSPPAFMHKDNARLITTGNTQDDLQLLADADWIAEAVVERLDVKRGLYEAIDKVRKPEAMVSSNTSTIPLAMLTAEMSAGLRAHFCITHFFNPVRYMRLLEIVAGPKTNPEVVADLSEFCDVALGKGVVPCKDTPGFLANRVGVFALQVGLIEAEHLGLTVEEADAIMGRPAGIPKTGVFGLYDLIGIDLMLDVVKSLVMALPDDDPFHAVADGLRVIPTLVAGGYTGNKGLGGFYRSTKSDAGPVREAVDLASGVYRPLQRPVLEAALAGERDGLRALVEHPDKYGEYAWRVLSRTLSYAASLLPEASDELLPIDEAMKLGYGWLRGPFEMLDELGAASFATRLHEEGRPVPEFISQASERSLYRAHEGKLQHLARAGDYRDVVRPPGVVRLTDVTKTSVPIAKNEAASLWDVGDNLACVEFHTKANALSPTSMELLNEAVQIAERDFAALVVHNDAPHFSVGFNLEFALEHAKRKSWGALDKALLDFQMTCKALKYATIPVVSAPAGMSVGGGYEVLVQSDALQAHANTVLGLVETVVGLIPSGGGCKEMLHRWTEDAASPEDALPGALRVFEIIGMAKTGTSPVEARPLRFFLDRDQSTMNRDRLLGEAKAHALELANDYAPPPPPSFVALGAMGKDAMRELLDTLERKGITTPHDLVVGQHLAWLLSGGDHKAGTTLCEDDLYTLEREAFIALADTRATVDRIGHMLENGQPLRN